MMEIESKPSLLNPLNLTKSTFQIPSKTLNSESRIRGLRKINSENLVKNPILTKIILFQQIMNRLQTTHSVYDINRWVVDDKKNSTLRRNISQNASKYLFYFIKSKI